jgi:Ca2+/Na+ antiporter
LDILLLVGCLLLLILGAWCVSEGGDILGEKYDATIVGGFLIAWLNTAPETIFFITALEGGNPNFAIGAMSGSVIVVCTIAVGTCVIVGASSRKTNSIPLFSGVRKQAALLGFSLIVPLCTLFLGFNYHLATLGGISYLLFVF